MHWCPDLICICPTDFEFLLDRSNPLPHGMPTSAEQWRLVYKWLGLWHQYFVWGFKYDSSLLQIYLEGRISKNFWILIYFWRFTSIRVRAGRWRVSNLFFLYISPLLFLPAPEINPKQEITTTKYSKSRILKYFMIFISFWKRFEHNR